MAEVTFLARLPAKLADGQDLLIEVLDEVTGLALNPSRAKMISQDQQNFGIKIPLPVGTVLKYRYVRTNDPIGIEYTTRGQQVRYRLYSVEGPGVVNDTIAGWKSTTISANSLGRIRGQVGNKSTNAPVVNALVSAGGVQTLTASDGSFLLEGLPPGTHNLVVYSLDGSFRTFQQGATIAPESTTPAGIMLNPSPSVSVTFNMTAPADSLKGVPVRMAGNIYPLGNTFADLSGGMNVLASRAPLMTLLPDGRYSLTLRLPTGLDLRYKYTLGDGFWNAEHASSGAFRVRQLIVPEKDITISDSVDTWKTIGLAPVTFGVTVPDSTPPSDVVSIQFNPFGWTEPIPMWPVAKNRWLYVLYSPLNGFNNASYRYCRNDQCGTATTANAQGKPFSPKDTDQTLADTVEKWAWSETISEPVIAPSTPITPRDAANFQAGAELMAGYRPSWQPYMALAFKSLKDTGANTVMLTPTWHATYTNPPVIEPVTGKDPLWFDLTQMATQAQQRGLSITIHPVVQYLGSPDDWWKAGTRDDGWWNSWFDRYRTFALYHADLASQTGAKMLVLGDASILPALPGGSLADGSSPTLPGDADQRWLKLIADVRSRYSGKLAWMLPYEGKLSTTPDFLKDVDLVYITVTPPLTKDDQPSQPDLENSYAKVFDSDILKLQEKTGHPIVIGLRYPSASGAADGCVGTEGNCLANATFQQPTSDANGAELGLKDQASAYSAALTILNQRSWIGGFYAVDYNPAVDLKDLSNSVRGKPASNVLWYWFPRLLGQQ